MFRILPLSIAAVAVLATPALAEGAPACSAPLGERPVVEGVTLEDVPASPDDLPGIRATSTSSGASMMIYHDAVSEPAARARASCFGAQLGLLEHALGDDRRGAEWDSVVFTSDPAYAPPRSSGVQSRWIIQTTDDGGLSAAPHAMIVSVMPHEQTHDYQGRAGARSPRWFSEGHATWIGHKVATRLDPVVAAADAAKQEGELASFSGSLNLAGWGGMQVKPEAILRQLSPEDRARKLADPTFSPSGPFRFGPDDVIGDESNTPARYAGAWKVFLGLEARHGADAVNAWVTEVTSATGPITPASLIESARARFGEDITPLLR